MKTKFSRGITPQERFDIRHTKDPETGCWLWDNPNCNCGYGGVTYEGKWIQASRFSWIVHYGEIPEGMCVLHKCDVRHCVNPDHLYIGDKKQNRKDYMERHPKAQENILKSTSAATAKRMENWRNKSPEERAALNKKRAEGRRRFWASMTDSERKEFVARRAAKMKVTRGY